MFWKRKGAVQKAVDELKQYVNEDASVVWIAKDDEGLKIHMSDGMGVDEAIGMVFLTLKHLSNPNWKQGVKDRDDKN